MEDSKNISNYQSNNMNYMKNNTTNNMSKQDRQDQLSMNSRSTSSALDPSKKIIKLLSLGNLDFTLTLSLSRTYFEMNEINFDRIESISDLNFLEHNKQLWKEITLTSNSKILRFVQQLNRATKEKFFVSFISLGKINYPKESKFFIVDILTYVTERNWIFLNYDDANDNDIQSRVCFKLICDGEEKSFELVEKNSNDEENKKESENKNQNEEEKENEKENINKSNINVNEQNNNNLNVNVNNSSEGKSPDKTNNNKNATNINKAKDENNSDSKLAVNNKNISRSQIIENKDKDKIKDKRYTKSQPNTQRNDNKSKEKDKDKEKNMDNIEQNKDINDQVIVQNNIQNCEINTNRNINDVQGNEQNLNNAEPCNPNETEALCDDDDDNILCNIKESLIQNFDYLYLDISFFVDKNKPSSITISHVLSFLRKIKEIYCTKIIVYYTNILSNLETSKEISNFQSILYLTDYYLFDKKDAFLILNFLHIIQHKDDHMKNDQLNMLQTGFSNKRYYNIELINSQFNYKNNILNNEAYKNYSNDKEGTKKEEVFTSRLNSANTSLYTTGMQNKITVSKLNRKKMFDYFKNEVILNSYFFNCKKIAVFIDNFSKINIMLASQKNNAQFFEYDTKIYPGINHSNLNMVEEYKGLIEKNYDYLIMIFFGTFIGKFILEKYDNNNVSRALYISYVTAVESSKKLLEIFKNNLPIPTDQKFFLVNVSTNQINNHFKRTNLTQKENKFTLDCINKNKSEYKMYNSLFDANLYPFFNSSANRNLLVQKGFINKKGYIMYDDKYRNIYTPEQMSMFNDPINKNLIYNSINRIRVGEDIKNKEVDVIENLLKKKQPINKKLPTLTANFATLGYTRKFDSYRNIFDRDNRGYSCNISCGGYGGNNGSGFGKYSQFRNTTNVSGTERMKINSGEASFRNNSQKNSRFNTTKKSFYKRK